MKARCPICLNVDDTYCEEAPRTGDRHRFDCERCGVFEISDTAYEDEHLRPESNVKRILRAALSHEIRTNVPPGFLITSDWLIAKLKEVKLPSAKRQEENFLRLIGTKKESDGEHVPLTDCMTGQVGALDKTHFYEMLDDMVRRELVIARKTVHLQNVRVGP